MPADQRLRAHDDERATPVKQLGEQNQQHQREIVAALAETRRKGVSFCHQKRSSDDAIDPLQTLTYCITMALELLACRATMRRRVEG